VPLLPSFDWGGLSGGDLKLPNVIMGSGMGPACRECPAIDPVGISTCTGSAAKGSVVQGAEVSHGLKGAYDVQEAENAEEDSKTLPAGPHQEGVQTPLPGGPYQEGGLTPD